MTATGRVTICVAVLALGLAGQSGLEAMTAIERPGLRARLGNVPLTLGDWVGEDLEVDPKILRESQADDVLNRAYEDRSHPGRRLWLWVNYSKTGLNMRHSPEICLPGAGWTKVESQCRVVSLPRPGAADAPGFPVMRLGYRQGELVQSVGFWYYIFGEGRLERYVRNLPVTNRSSHGRTTRGSGMTVEVFCPGPSDPDGSSLRDFAGRLLAALEPILPAERANYHVP